MNEMLAWVKYSWSKGFNLEEAAFIIHYDLPYNTLKLEQRIDRCHRLGQENDVLSVAFIQRLPSRAPALTSLTKSFLTYSLIIARMIVPQILFSVKVL